MAEKKSRVATQLEQLRGQLETEQHNIEQKTAPLYKQRESLVAKIQPLEKQLADLDEKIKAEEEPLREVRNGLAQLARAGGSRVMTNGLELERPPAATEAIAEVKES